MKQVTLTKQGGRVSVDADLDGLFSTLRNGVYTITIKRKTEKRSIAQNDLMWLWLTCIKRETGTPKEDAYLYYCKKFLLKRITFADRLEAILPSTYGRGSRDADLLHLDNLHYEKEKHIQLRILARLVLEPRWT